MRLSSTNRRLLAHPSARLGALLVTALVLFALFAPLLSGYDGNASDFVHGIGPGDTPAAPSWAHWLGTDRIFRDQLTRLAMGARLSLFVGLGASLLATALGGAVGVVAGYFEGSFTDALLMRLVDVGLSFPFLLLVMAVGAALETTSAVTVLLLLGAGGWLGTARLVRAKTMQVRTQDYVAAARALGLSTARILGRHVLPNVAGTLIFTATLAVAQMLLAESVLSYLGAGVPPPAASWGRMLLEGQDFYQAAPWLLLGPALAVVIAALAFHLLGEGMRDVLQE
jgi:peptide/nickel transport system permease protein